MSARSFPARADPRSFIPTPGNLTAIAKADLVFINSAGYEEGLLDAIESDGERANIVVASAFIK